MIQAGLVGDRKAVLSGIDQTIVAALKDADSPAGQLRLDLDALNHLPLFVVIELGRGIALALLLFGGACKTARRELDLVDGDATELFCRLVPEADAADSTCSERSNE